MLSNAPDEFKALLRQMIRSGSVNELIALSNDLRAAVVEARAALMVPVPERRIGIYTAQEILGLNGLAFQFPKAEDHLASARSHLCVGIPVLANEGSIDMVMQVLVALSKYDEYDSYDESFVPHRLSAALHLDPEPQQILLIGAGELKSSDTPPLNCLKRLRYVRQDFTFPDYAKVPFSETLQRRHPVLVGEVAGSKRYPIQRPPPRRDDLSNQVCVICDERLTQYSVRRGDTLCVACYQRRGRGRPAGRRLLLGEVVMIGGINYRNLGAADLYLRNAMDARNAVIQGLAEIVPTLEPPVVHTPRTYYYVVGGQVFDTLAAAQAAAVGMGLSSTSIVRMTDRELTSDVNALLRGARRNR